MINLINLIKKGKIFLLAAVLVLALAQVALPELRGVGPVLPDADGNPLTAPWSAGYNGFPTWYRDSLGQMATLSNPPSPLSIPDPVDPLNPFSVQVGWGAEAFYWSSDSTLDLGGGNEALLVMALEAAWAAEVPNPGDQMVFARVRFRIDAAVAGDYTVIFPYGTRTFTVAPADVGRRAVNETSDIGATPGVFTGALQGEIGPFLRQVGAAAGTFGDGTPGPVVNGPNGNIFRVIGPPGSGIDAQTAEFVTSGEMFAGTPFRITRTTFSRDAGGTRFAEVFGNTPAPVTPGIAFTANLPAQAPQPLTLVGNLFFGRFQFPNALPAQVTVTASAPGLTATSLQGNLVDTILINKATYSVANSRLTIAATSSDAQAVLRGFNWVGATAAGRPLPAAQGADNIFNNITIAPTTVTVKSALGGSETVQTTILP